MTGVAGLEAADAGDVPARLVAVTVNVYAVPLVSPVTMTLVALVAPLVVADLPPGAAVTVYWVIAEPPSLVGAVHDTTAWALPAVARTAVGAVGAVPSDVAFVTDTTALALFADRVLMMTRPS